MAELVTIVVLVDEEGHEQEFESLGSVEYNKEIYEFFLPCNISTVAFSKYIFSHCR